MLSQIIVNTCFMHDLDRVESQLYSGSKNITLLQELTELRHFQTFRGKKLEAATTALLVTFKQNLMNSAC